MKSKTVTGALMEAFPEPQREIPMVPEVSRSRDGGDGSFIDEIPDLGGVGAPEHKLQELLFIWLCVSSHSIPAHYLECMKLIREGAQTRRNSNQQYSHFLCVMEESNTHGRGFVAGTHKHIHARLIHRVTRTAVPLI